MVTKLKHYNPKAAELTNDWQVLDASGQVLGRLATQVATFLMGKHKPSYVPHMLTGDFVVVTNAKLIKVTGLKAEQKIYKRHSQYPGNLKEIPFARMQERQPERIIELAVKGMLPKNKLGRQMLRRLKVYAGAEHPHEAQILGSERREAREEAAAVKAEAAAVEAAKAAPKKAAAAPSGDQMLFLRHGYGYSVGEVDFTRAHPYQLVDAVTAKRLLATTQFETATQEQVKEHYGE
jgi:large subunit ribosomal protein L13